MKEYVWKVVKGTRFVGYVTAISEWEALRDGTNRYGSNIWVERMWESSAVSPKMCKVR